MCTLAVPCDSNFSAPLPVCLRHLIRIRASTSKLHADGEEVGRESVSFYGKLFTKILGSAV